MDAVRAIRTGMIGAALLGATLSSAVPARAAGNDEARLAIHLVSPTTKNACSRSVARPACASTVTAGGLYPILYYAHILVQNGDPLTGIAGLQCGIRYNGASGAGIDIFTWTNCATLEFTSGGWPASNSGTLITWDASLLCQRTEPGGNGTGVVATAGYFYLAAYSPDALEIIPRPVDGAAKVADCLSVEYLIEGQGVHHDPSYLGLAAFSAGGSTPGYNPCATAGGGIDCTITGPATVFAGTAGLGYSAAAAPPGALFQWTVSGNAAIVGSTTGQSVSVTAGAVGSFDISVEVTSGGSSLMCSSSIAVTAPPSLVCSINGPESVPELFPNLWYNVTATAPITSIAWSISGNGTIVGPTNLTNVYVSAGAPGAFDLTANVGDSLGRFTSCLKTVTVNAVVPPTCLIAGPSSVGEGVTTLTYSVTPSVPVSSLQWSISGEGTITSGTTGATVTVTAGNPGAFDLGVTFVTPGGASGQCALTVTVTPFQCSIAGPNALLAGSVSNQYSVGTLLTGATYAWGVTGNAVISGSNTGATVTVTAGSPGTCTITLDHTRNGVTQSCSRSVNILPGSPGGPNIGARILVHLMTPTTKAQCTRSATLPSCQSVVYIGSLYPQVYFAHLLVQHGNALAGVAGLQCGIEYNAAPGAGVDVFSWALCATLEFPSTGWPASGGGNLITWDPNSSCQRTVPPGNDPTNGVVANAGYFYLAAYSPDYLTVIPRPIDTQAKVADCSGIESLIGGLGYPPNTPSNLGRASFGQPGGYNPCGWSVSVQPTTWSAIKAQYGDRVGAAGRKP